MRILITGATSGIGFEVAKRMASRGHFVTIATHTKLQCKNLKDNIANIKNIECIKLDITSKKDRQELQNMDIDCLFNNAGIGYGGSISEIDMSSVRKNFEVNVFSSFEILQLVLKKMIEKNHGRIVIMSSLLGIMPIKFLGVYSATKASIISLTTTLRKEIKMLNKNIDICIVEPGAYNTGFNQVMLENKYSWMEKESYFKEFIPEIRKKEKLKFDILEFHNFNSIINKIVNAIENENPKFIYRAPFLQVLGVKLYNFLFM